MIGDRALARARRRRRRGWARRSSARCSRQGIAACGKHFPGPRRHQHAIRTTSCRWSSIDRDRLDAVELVPFRARDRGRRRGDHDRARAGSGARRGAAGDAFADDRRPACSRSKLGFGGVVISDDLGMKAVSGRYGLPGGDGGGDRRRLRRGAAVQLDAGTSRWRRSRPSSAPPRTGALPASASTTRWRGSGA